MWIPICPHTHTQEEEGSCEVSGKDPAGSDTPELIKFNEVASDRFIGGLMNFDVFFGPGE